MCRVDDCSHALLLEIYSTTTKDCPVIKLKNDTTTTKLCSFVFLFAAVTIKHGCVTTGCVADLHAHHHLLSVLLSQYTNATRIIATKTTAFFFAKYAEMVPHCGTSPPWESFVVTEQNLARRSHQILHLLLNALFRFVLPK